jgi:hypothetical protein
MFAKLILATAASLLVMSAASAEDLDFSKIKCSEFLSAPKDEIATVLTWLEGFYTKEDAPPILYSDKIAKDAKALSGYCNAHRDDDIIKAADTVMPVK